MPLTKQEEIRGIEDIIASYHNGVPFVDEAPEILRYLKSVGMVRKVERDLPQYCRGCTVAKELFNKKFLAVEELI